MEYDNDRVIRPTSKIEIFYWGLAFLLYPVINFLSFFSADIVFLPILVGISALIFPFYLLYSKVIVPTFLYTKRYVLFCTISIAFYAAIHLLLMFFYSFFHLENSVIIRLQSYQRYFTYSTTTFIREGAWCMINMIFATSISFLRKHFDDEELLTALEKDNINFKLKYLRSQLNPHFLFNTLKAASTPSVYKKMTMRLELW